MNPKDKVGSKKPPISLVPPAAIIYLSEAFREGDVKYGAYNWRREKVQLLCYIDAIMRHALAIIDGEDIDPESGKPHISGILASAAVIADARETGNLIDNRPVKGVAGEMIRKISESNNLVTSSLVKDAPIFGPAGFTGGTMYLDDSKCLTMEEAIKRREDPNDTYGKGYCK